MKKLIFNFIIKFRHDNRSWSDWGRSEPSHPPFPDTFLGSKEDLDWLKIDLNAAKIITVQNYRVFIPKSEEFSNKFE